MKKLVAILAMLLTISPTMGMTNLETHWQGSGLFDVHFTAGDDAETHFWTEGSTISGELYATDSNDNPYNYGVDTVEAKIKAYVENGYLEYAFKKNDNYEPMYGGAGQSSYTFIGTEGTGNFAWKSWSNYAQLRNSNYGWQNDNQIRATGNHIIHHEFFIDDSYSEGASIDVSADAETNITIMCEDHWQSSFKFGKGCGCYTNAKVNIENGSGSFDLNAWADNEITTDWGIEMSGGHLNVHSEFAGAFHWDNFALEGN